MAASSASGCASTAAGAVAGTLYHVATFPIERAKAFSAPDVSVGAVAAAVRSEGWLSLYRGVVRT